MAFMLLLLGWHLEQCETNVGDFHYLCPLVTNVKTSSVPTHSQRWRKLKWLLSTSSEKAVKRPTRVTVFFNKPLVRGDILTVLTVEDVDRVNGLVERWRTSGFPGLVLIDMPEAAASVPFCKRDLKVGPVRRLAF